MGSEPFDPDSDDRTDDEGDDEEQHGEIQRTHDPSPLVRRAAATHLPDEIDHQGIDEQHQCQI